MHLSLERTGGFAGISKTISVDTDTLSTQKAEELSRLVASADFFQLPARMLCDHSQRDRFQYKLTIEAHGQQHTVIINETALTNNLRTLIEFLNQL